jgi:hypothetical protein
LGGSGMGRGIGPGIGAGGGGGSSRRDGAPSVAGAVRSVVLDLTGGWAAFGAASLASVGIGGSTLPRGANTGCVGTGWKRETSCVARTCVPS